DIQAGINARVDLVGLPVGQATGAAGINASIGIDLNDDNEDPSTLQPAFNDNRSLADRHDGRLYFDEINTIIKTNAGDPLCLFDLGGQLSAYLQITLDVIGVFHKEFSFNWPLLQFNLPCSVNRPAGPNQDLANILKDTSGNSI